jgi:DNA-binding MarR family transcriptional regulator
MVDATTPRISYVVKRLESALRAQLDLICRDKGITTMQYVALSVLHVHPGMSSAQLAARSFVSPQSANQMVTTLERTGYLVRAPYEQNRRILQISLTEKGLELLAACDGAVDDLESTMLEGVDDGAQKVLRQAVNTCIRNLSPNRLAGRT